MDVLEIGKLRTVCTMGATIIPSTMVETSMASSLSLSIRHSLKMNPLLDQDLPLLFDNQVDIFEVYI